MNKSPKFLYLFLAAGLMLSTAGAQSVTTDPVGFVTLTIGAGNGSGGRTLTPLSIPLLANSVVSGQVAGVITSVTSSSITNSNAGWTAGQLSAVATPQLIKITSGVAKGRTLLISTDSNSQNTANTVFIDPADLAGADIAALQIAAGDTYQIFACDTLAILFGDPGSTGIVGGSSLNTSDNVIVAVNGQLSTYYYATTGLNSPGWVQASFGNPASGNTPIRPDSGVNFSRVGSADIVLTILGSVPSTNRLIPIKDAGVTYLAQGWPVDVLLSGLSGLNLQNSPNWTSNSSPNSADTVTVKTSNGLQTFFYDGANWREQSFGNPVSNNVVIPAGSMILINQRGIASGTSLLNQTIPYTL
ncbi:MAG: hypothetical protein ABIT76_01935 [Chthoniobacterales bacterium]